MVSSASERRALLESLADAFARGDSPTGEMLFMEALDQDLPWEEITATAARGFAHRFEAPETARRPARRGAA